jgi:hypothetical protein
MKRIYYPDVPAAYSKLNDVFPPLSVKPFGHFFAEAVVVFLGLTITLAFIVAFPFRCRACGSSGIKNLCCQHPYNPIVKRKAFFNRGNFQPLVKLLRGLPSSGRSATSPKVRCTLKRNKRNPILGKTR